MNVEFWMIFAGTVFAVSMIPGPSTLIAFSHGAQFGWVRVLVTAFGNAAASILQAVVAGLGLGIVIAQSAVLFLAIKYIGAAYLVYLGVSMWRNAANSGVKLSGGAVPDQGFRLFRSGFLVAASNPKAIIFFTALFPQFLGAGEAGQLVGMVMIVGIVAFSVAMIYGVLGAQMRALNITQSVMEKIHKTTGGLFICSGVGLMATKS